MENKNIRFALTRINTDQFALIEKSYHKEDEVKLNIGLQFGANKETKTLRVKMSFDFAQNNTPFIVIQATCFFSIDPDGWVQFADGAKVNVPKSLATHLTLLTVGTLRGILHSKTEGTNFNGFVIPTVNVTDLVTNDVCIRD